MHKFAIRTLALGLCLIGGSILVDSAAVKPGSSVKTYTVKADQPKPLAWWQQEVVYQIYPRSFQDSDGDGIGDINGITSKLDYLVELGVGAVWISPIYKSPMADFGYDISNFTDIEPQFGTLEDFSKMAAGFKARNLKLVMDFVPNHSSDQHEWFIKSVQRIEPYTDYYVWKDANGTDADGKPKPPNNWVSIFGGSAWEYNAARQQFYLHQFVKEQPDLNFENILVRNEILAAVKFWLDRGVDGFRVDAVPFLYEDLRYLDEPEDPDRPADARPDESRYWKHIYTQNLPEVRTFLADIRQLLDVYSAADGQARCMMVEAYIPDESIGDYYGDDNNPVAHFPFNFHLLSVRPNSTAEEVLAMMNIWFDLMPEGKWASFTLGNHDNNRTATRWTPQGVDGANMVNLLLKGTPVTYYGEELGMEDTPLTWEQTVDPAGCNTDPERYHLFSRDPERTPMQWDNSKNAGFSTGNKTWLPLNENYTTVNVAAQRVAEESHLKVYKEIVKLRNTNAWRYGEYESAALNSNTVIGFTRIAPRDVDAKGFVVLINLSDTPQTVSTSIFQNVPANGTVLIRSVGFQETSLTAGSQVDTHSVPLGPRNSIVIQIDSTV